MTNAYPIGVNTWIWVSPLTDERLAALAPRIKAWGFDLIELPVENLGDWDPTRAAENLAEHGLGASIAAVMPTGRDLLTDDPEITKRTQEYLIGCIDAAVTVGSKVVGGPFYSAVGRLWLLDAAERERVLAHLVERLRPVADYAGQCGVRLALEPLNRYETSLVNTVTQGLEIVQQLDSPACGLLLDTFHLNMEEIDLPAAFRAAGPWIAHVHACANDRGAPGADHLDWPGIAVALHDTGYAGSLVIESFTAENRTIATSAAIWRPMARTQDAIATDGLAFLRRIFGS